ncbi:ROK family protein [Candidatus Woesearchaeota archaeon]|nr:ROK family protein [Nanoarchaeota archaeon]MCB9370226.1 ROK family protein [Candidatus Woesearchaeota archaeon]USN44751.1 MAG: ROK family protein [Candidatus Woesearchaeota archaeon]
MIKAKQVQTYLITCDVGGTSSRFALFDLKKKIIISLTKVQTKTTKEFLNDLSTFIEEQRRQGREVSTCVLSVAAPVLNREKVSLTNASLTLDKAKLKEKLKLQEVHFLNDFEALAYAAADIDLKVSQKEGFIQEIKKAKFPIKQDQEIRAVIGVGTGLGASFAVKNKEGSLLVLPSEGGHSPPFFVDELSPFLRALTEHNKGLIDLELLCSGKGLPLIARTLAGSPKAFEAVKLFFNSSLKQTKKSLSKKEEVKLLEQENFSASTLFSLSKQSDIAHYTLELLNLFFAKACQNLALMSIPYSGIFITGGVIQKNPNLLEKALFKKYFLETPRKNMRNLLDKIPLYLLKDEDIVHKGCAKFFETKYEKTI